MKKLIVMMMLLLCISFNAKAIKLFGSDLDLNTEVITGVLNRNLPKFAQSIGAAKYSFKVNNNLPNLPQTDKGFDMTCSVEITMVFKATQIDNSYCLLRAMLSSKYGTPADATAPKTMAKRCVMWTTSSGQVLLYTLGETAYIQYYVFRFINETYTPAL